MRKVLWCASAAPWLFVAMSLPVRASAQQPGGAVETDAPEVKVTEGAPVEEILVTGSRVPRKDLTTPAPVTVVNRQEFVESGQVTLGEFLQMMPEQGNALNRQMNNGGDGSTRLSLRSLGDYRTLVLLNGRRVVAAGVGADMAVDLNTIPSAAVERVEILKDGASPIYGSEAIGGVVNVITRKRWNGVEATARTGVSSRGDAASYVASLAAGSAQDSGSYLVTASYEDLRSAMAGDRAFAAKPHTFDYRDGTLGTTGSGAVPQGRIAIDRTEMGVCTGNQLWCDLVTAYPDDRRFIWDSGAPGGLGWRPMDTTAIAGEGGDLYNYQPENYLVTPLRLLSLLAVGDRRLGDSSRLYFEASYVNRLSDQMLAPLPIVTVTEGITVSRDNVYNPFGRDFGDVARRLTEVDRRRFAEDVDTFRLVGGLDGAFPEGLGPVSEFQWDLSTSYGRTRATQQIDGYLTLRGLADALGPSFVDPGPDGVLQTPIHAPLQGDDVAVCGTPSNPIAGCVPVDLFNGPGSITPQMVNELTYSGITRGESELLALSANVSGPLFRLGSDRPVGLAAGYEYRTQSGLFVPDTMAMRGDRRDVRESPTRGTTDVHELYAELAVPIVSGARLARELEVTAAARAFRHRRFDPDWTWKLGTRWKPAGDVTLRGTASTAYRVPSIRELFQGERLADENFIGDPCADFAYDPVWNPFMTPEREAWCRAAGVPDGGTLDIGVVPAPVVGNAALRPETARVFTAGVVLEPRFAKGLSVTLDYWDVRVESAIGAPFAGLSGILDLCYPSRPGVQPRLCHLVDRDPATGRLRGVTDQILNSDGSEAAAGVDAAARWQGATSLGQIGASLEVAWLRRHDVELIDGTVLHGKGTYDLYFQKTALTGMNPEWKYVLGLRWSRRGVAAGASVRYVSGFEECASDDPFAGQPTLDACSGSLFGAPFLYSRRVPSWTSVDAFLEYEVGTAAGRTRFGAGVQNALDEPPPFIASAFNETDPSGYGYLGRYFYGRVSHRF